MTYQTLEEIERFGGRLEAEKIAARYVAVKRLNVQRVREAIDETVDDADDEERRLWGLGYVD